MKRELSERIKIIDNSLNKFLPVINNPQSGIYDSMRYSLFAGGKRLRPILMWETAKICGGDWETIEPFACAIEMIHTYSLIHDDLPAMDNDDLRRGMPTNHIRFGESTAILAGDALLNKAFEIISSSRYTNPAAAMRAMSYLSASSGTEGMIGGQIVDIASEGKKITPELLKYIHKLKTGALINAACVIGGILMQASEKEISAIDDFSTNLGIAFQIRDDILDVTGNENEIGKPIGSDTDSEKSTYVSIYGLDESEKLVKMYSDKAVFSLDIFGAKADFLIRLTNYLVNRTN